MKFVAFLFLLFIALIGLTVVSRGCNWIGKAADVVQNEIAPDNLLKKYEWFKDASAQLDKKMADILVYEHRLKALVEAYPNESRSKWARDDREQFSIWSSEVAGIKASFNSLAADYNSQMAKINWRFCNVGDLPRGASVALPREYKNYLEN